MKKSSEIQELKAKIKALEKELAQLKNKNSLFHANENSFIAPKPLEELFSNAQQLVESYFQALEVNPAKALIKIKGQRYILMRASAVSYDFVKKFKSLYTDKTSKESQQIVNNLLFDLAHIQGMEDAKNYHQKMHLKNPVQKLSAGPVHFAYTGWAKVEVLKESNPVNNENFYLKYHHPYSFEADSWIEKGEKSDAPVCIMNAGYSSGWCEQSYGMPLTAVEITCRAKGDKNCTFIMAPPHKIQAYLPEKFKNKSEQPIPLFFERQKAQAKLQNALKEKDILLRELHHRVKNNLQIISSLIKLQSEFLNDENAKLFCNAMVNRIKTIALVHQKFDIKNEKYDATNLSDYIESVCMLICESFFQKKVTIAIKNKTKKPIMLQIDKAIPIGLIINELLFNAFKHAFKKQDESIFTIEINKIK